MQIKSTLLMLGLSFIAMGAVAAETSKTDHPSESKQLYFADKDMKFPEGELAQPVRRNAMIVPTFKIQERKRLTQEGQLVSETTHTYGAGMEFRRGSVEPVKRQLKVEINKDLKNAPATVQQTSQNTVAISDIVILDGQK